MEMAEVSSINYPLPEKGECVISIKHQGYAVYAQLSM